MSVSSLDEALAQPEQVGGRRKRSAESSLTSTVVSSEWTAIWYTGAAAAGVLLLFAVWVWRKGRPFASGDVFRASRLSGYTSGTNATSGNMTSGNATSDNMAGPTNLTSP